MAGDGGDADDVLRLLFRHSPVPQFVSRTDGSVVAANPAFGEMLGTTGEGVEGLGPADVTHPDDLPALVQAGTQLLRGEVDDVELELRVRNAAGEWRWCVTTCSLAHSAGGEPLFLSQLLDITPRKEAEERLAISEARFRSLAEFLPLGVHQRDLAGRLVYVNPTWLAITGIEEKEALGQDHIEVIHPDDREKILGASLRLAEAGGTYHEQFRVIRADGAVRWVSSRARWFPGPDGRAVGYVGSLEDITELLDSQEERDRLANIAEVTSDLVGVVDAEGYIVYANAAARAAYGIESLDPPIHSAEVYTEESIDRFFEHLLPILSAGRTWTGELDMLAHDGEVIRVWQSLAPHLGPDGHLQHISAVGRDITEQRRQTARLAHQATHDALTGLPNRAFLLEELERLVERQVQSGVALAVLFLDLDQLKAVNDELGHDAGDDLLRAVADRLSDVLRPHDLVARLGGDEFVVVCREVASEEAAMEVAARLVDALADTTFVVRGREMRVTASVGVTVSRGGPGEHPEGLLREADAAMYVAKAKGRNRFEVFVSQRA